MSETTLGQESIPETEESLINELLIGLRKKASLTPDKRQQHSKSHGLLTCRLSVLPNLPSQLQTAFFQPAATFTGWLRLTNGASPDESGNFPPDTKADIRGLALKFSTPERLGIVEQDFAFVNTPQFFLRNVREYLDFFPIARAVKEKVIVMEPGKPPIVPENMRENFDKVSHAFRILARPYSQNVENPLEIQYWTATPFKYGNNAAKYSLIPKTPCSHVTPKDENYLRKAVTEQLNSADVEYDFAVQLQVDPEKMPIEDAIVEWSTDLSPFVKVATLTIPKQDFSCPDRLELESKLSFSPWHCHEDHRPLGSVNRARRVYTELAKNRS